MEMSLVRHQALGGSAQASLSRFVSGERNQRCPGCGNPGLRFSALKPRGLSASACNWRESVGHARRGTSVRSSGGTRRDDSKSVAKTQRRRIRHVKGVTPTKPELFDELQAEEEADEELDRFEARSESDTRNYEGDNVVDDSEEYNNSSNGEDGGGSEPNEEQERWDQVNGTSNNSNGVEEIVEAGNNTLVIKYFPEGKPKARGGAKGSRKNVPGSAGGEFGADEDNVKAAADEVTSAAKDATDNFSEAGDSVLQTLGDVAQEGGEVIEEVSDVTKDTAEDVSIKAQDTAEDATKQVQDTVEDVSQTAQDTAEDVTQTAQDTAEDVTSIVQETVEDVTNTAQETAEDLTNTVQETAESTGKTLSEAGDELQEGFEEESKQLTDTVAEVTDIVQDTAEDVASTAADTAEEVGKNLEEAGDIVLETLDEVGSEFLTAVKEGGSSVREQLRSKRPEPSSTEGKKDIQGKTYQSTRPKENVQEDKELYKGLRVTVAGASGRTGRLLVAELSRKGVPVRALVRDKTTSDARALVKLPNVEVVETDLYKYESIKKSLGDCNVVISAIGARSFAFDPIGTYQGEFEGVKNLVAAAKNKGDVKKFVFITSLGVTFLQIVPLIFWKKQSELYLQRSGLDYTIVRPGGLTNGASEREIVSMNPADTQFRGSISRQKVAEVCVAALITPEASEKIVEIVSGGRAEKTYADLFGSI